MQLGLLQQLVVLKRKDYLTLAAASCGLLAMYSAMMGYVASGLLIFAAVILDYLDGFVARAGKKPTANEFGKNLDSLSDAVAFGTAPAAIAMALRPDIFGFVAALLYLCCTLVRLGLFSLQKSKDFYGLPSPAAAVIVAGLSVVYPDPVVMPVALVACAALMVSGFRIARLQL